MLTNLSSVNLTLLIISIVLFVIVLGGAVAIIVLRIRKNKSLKEIDDYRFDAFNKEVNRYKKARQTYKNKIKNQDFLDHDKALNDMKTILDEELDEYKKQKLLTISQDLENKKHELLKEMLLNTMQQLHLKVINESSVHYLPINDKFKPLLIGKKGANIKYLNEITNCNINIARDSQYVEISCPNPYDKQLAINTISHLLKSQAFDLNAISNVYKKEARLMVKDCIDTGKKYLGILNIQVSNPDVYEYVGRLKYRWSFSQNVLEHCYEVALICESLAKQLGLDPQTAKEVGFFHDIGKSMDYAKRYDHIDTGIKIAKRCDLSQEVINGILKHHRTNCNEDYVLLVRCADAWSAARTGARHVPTANEENTIKIIEAKISKIQGIVSFKVDVKDNIVNVVFVPIIPNKSNYLKIKYDIIRLIKKDVRLNKLKVVIHE